jgi:ribose transport system ATP-binding protein
MSEQQFENGSKYLLEVKGLKKIYPGVIALNEVDFDIHYGEVHCLVGENGAGKSTLIEILGGTIAQDGGTIKFEDKKVNFKSPKNAQEKGIAVLHQELPALPDLTVAENIYVSRLPIGKFGLLDYKKLYKEANYWLDLIHSEIDSREIFGNLPIAKQQLVSIAKALSLDAKLIFFDEPSAVLTLTELDRLFNIIKDLKNQQKGIVYISHRLDEIFEIGDRVTVLRNGNLVETNTVTDTTKDDLIRQMVGREVNEVRLRDCYTPDETVPIVIEVKNLNQPGVLNDINFHVTAGEIVGFFGLVGAGRTEIARAIIGADPVKSGSISIRGTMIARNNPQKALKSGMCLIPEDRKLQGLLLHKSIRENIALPSLSDLSSAGMWLDSGAVSKRARNFTEKLSIKTPSIEQKTKNLSGGNQQKIVLAKWLSRDMEVYIFDEPTRGVDVGAKEEIRKLIIELAAAGKAIILISSEIPEILTLSDRVLVMHNGSITADIPVTKATQEKLLRSSMGEA